MFAWNCSRGRGGGAATFLPGRSKEPLWQAHQMSLVSGRYCTRQERWGQTAGDALNSPLGPPTSSPGFDPILKIFPLLTGKSETLPATTLATEASASTGGRRKLTSG